MKAAKFFLKAVVSLSFIIFILHKIDIEQLTIIILKTNPFIFIIAFILLNISLIINMYRLSLFFPKAHYHVAFKSMLRIHYISFFFNLLLPGRIGGDIIRAYSFMRLTDEKSKTIVIIILWRAIGMTSLLCIASIMLFFNEYIIRYVELPFPFVTSVWIMLIGILGLLFMDARIVNFCIEKIKLTTVPFKNKLNYVLESIQFVLPMKKIIAKNLFLSIISHGLIFICFFILSIAIQHKISLFLFFLFSPIVGIIQQIPITIGGIGLREGSYVFLFMKAGIRPEIILSITMLYYILNLLIGMIGCGLYMTSDVLKRKYKNKLFIDK